METTQLYGVIDNYDSTGKPAGALGFAGTVSTKNRYGRLRYLARSALMEAYGKFMTEYAEDYRELPRYSQSREALMQALTDTLREIPQGGDPKTLGDMLEEI